MGPFFADLGLDSGHMLYRDVAGSIEVFGNSDHSAPVGRALCIGWDPAGSAVWRLVVDDEELEGPWVIVDGEFLATWADWPDLYGSDFHHDADARRGRASLASGRRRAGRTRTQGGPSEGLSSAVS